MTRERIWFIFTLLILLVLVIAFTVSKTSQPTEVEVSLYDQEEYLVDKILPDSNTKPSDVTDVPEKVTETIEPGHIGEGCFVGGCSNQICTDVEDVSSTCEWHETYACYNNGICEVQPDGECGWTRTDEIMQCLAEVIPDLALYIK